MRSIPFLCLLLSSVLAIEYPYGTVEPQPEGWPLSKEAEEYVLKRPMDRGENWISDRAPVTPAAGFYSEDNERWLNEHKQLLKKIESTETLDVLLLGDITSFLWNPHWSKYFGYSMINLALQGDMIQNILWRLDHGGVPGIKPEVIILHAGTLNIGHAHHTKTFPIALGIKLCYENLREKFPNATIIIVKLFPQKENGHPYFNYTQEVNSHLDSLNLHNPPKTYLFDLTPELLCTDGSLKEELYDTYQARLNPSGYQVFAEKLKPILESVINSSDEKK